MSQCYRNKKPAAQETPQVRGERYAAKQYF
jgi:hypothetical protein